MATEENYKISLRNIANFFIVAISIVVVLSLGRNLLIPLVFALLLWFVVKQIRFFMDKMPFIKKHIPNWLKNIVSFLLIFYVIQSIIDIVLANIRLLLVTYQRYEANLGILINKVNDTFGIDLMEHLQVYVADIDFGAMFFSLFSYSTDIVGKMVMVIIYAVFVFLEEPSFQAKLKLLFPDKAQFDNTYMIIERIERSTAKYLGLKTLIGLTTSIISYIILVIIGVDFPVFWAFLIFVLNFIPAIGSIVATLFPVVFSLLQFGDFFPALMVLLFVGSTQFFIGNIMDPRLMGNSVNLSPLVIILSLSFWGAIWGITGMLLSVPIMVIIVIILAKIPYTRSIAILLSRDGYVD